MINVLTVLEHQRIDNSFMASAQMSASDYQWLLEQTLQGRLPCFEYKIYQGQPVLVVRHYLALLLLPSGCYLEILPKVSQIDNPADLQNSRQGVRALIKALLPKLSSLNPIAISAAASTSHVSLPSRNMDTPCDWIKVLLALWQQELANLPAILPTMYIKQWHNHPQAQGKLHLKSQIQHNAHRPHYRYVRESKLTWHPAWYALFSQALRQMQRFGIAPNMSSKRAIHTLGNAVLNAKNDLTQQLTQQRHMPLYSRAFYQKLLTFSGHQHSRQSQLNHQAQVKQSFVIDMACWLLNLPQNKSNAPVQTLPNLGLANLSEPLKCPSDIHAANFAYLSHTPALMFNMPKMFEQWVGWWLEQRLPNRVQMQQTTIWLTDEDGEKKFIRPDLQILPMKRLPKQTSSQSPQSNESNAFFLQLAKLGLTTTSHLVIDIKYKQLNSLSQVLASDLYQIYSYQNLLKADTAWLIYPANDFLNQPKQLRLNEGGYIYLLGFDMIKGELLIKI